MTPPDPHAVSPIPLNDLRRGETAQVSGLNGKSALGATDPEAALLLARLRDLGFVNGARCEVLARMWFGGDPLVVRIGGSTFALRRVEAAAVLVQRVPAQAAAPAHFSGNARAAIA